MMRRMLELVESRNAARNTMTTTISLYLSLAPVAIVSGLLSTLFQRGVFLTVIAWLPFVSLVIATWATYVSSRRTMRYWQEKIDATRVALD